MQCEWKRVRDWDEKENKNINYGAAWSVFGKWIAGHPDKTDIVRTENKELKGTGHICIVLRGSFFTLYYYELTSDLTEEQRKIFEQMRIVFDKILIANQAVIEILDKSKWKSIGMTGQGIFPAFFNKYDPKLIAEYSDYIEEEINMWKNEKYVYKNIDRDQEIKRFLNSREFYKIKDQYGQLLSMLVTLKPTLPEKNMNIIDTIIERCEYGYFLGYLTEKKIKKPGKPNKKFLQEKVNKYRKGRENKVKQASYKAFGSTEKVKRRLERMFIYEKI